MISIIIPVFNRSTKIVNVLESLQKQSLTHWECIVVDDGSNDDSIFIVERKALADPRILLLNRPINGKKGPNSCRNYGFSKSKGELIYFLDSDDVLLPGALEKYQSSFGLETEVVIAPIFKVKDVSRAVGTVNTIISNNLIEDYFTGVVSFYVCGPMWRRTFLEQQPELFDEALRNLDDFDFNLRMWYAKPKAVFLEEPTVLYLQHTDSLKQELSKGNRYEIASAYRARFKHLELLSAQDPANKQKYQRHIAHFYKKTLRQALIHEQKEWKDYYCSAVSLLWEVKQWRAILSVSVGTLSYLLCRRGYGFFE